MFFTRETKVHKGAWKILSLLDELVWKNPYLCSFIQYQLLLISINAKCKIQNITNIILRRQTSNVRKIRGKPRTFSFFDRWKTKNIHRERREEGGRGGWGEELYIAYLKHPLKVFKVIRINGFNVKISNFCPQYMLVERSSEMDIQELPIKKCFSNLKR